MDDITKRIISSAFVSQNVPNFFPDSIFLDRMYNIVAISGELCLRLGYRPNELTGRSLSALRDADLLPWLSSRLVPGYFVNERMDVTLKSGQRVEYIVSGFYLGILGPVCNLIILRFDPRSEAKELNNKLNETRSQIDNFIYRTAHDLRGPLATVQGLIYLLNLRKDDSEVNHFISLISLNCKKLEERLTHLVYLSTAAEEFRLPSYQMRISDVESALRRTIERNSFVDYLKLWISGSDEIIEGYNEVLTLSVVNNVLMYILSLPITMQANIYVEISEEKELNVILKAIGFKKDDKIEQVIQDADASHYVDVLQASNFTYIYAALKIAAHLRATISYSVIDLETQQIRIVIPKGIETSTE
jgi:signal transduction histidine kinase